MQIIDEFILFQNTLDRLSRFLDLYRLKEYILKSIADLTLI